MATPIPDKPPRAHPGQTSPPDGDALAAVMDAVRARSPRVHCITNSVVTTFTANVLLAAGAVPSMTIDPHEVPAFVSSADALLVNLGTLDPMRREAVASALEVCRHRGLPWVLDPVMVDRSAQRCTQARAWLASRPAAVRANSAELDALGPCTLEAAAVACTGDPDRIRDRTGTTEIHNGHPLMTRVTGVGCVGSALVGACLAVEADPGRAAAAALAWIGVAGERAARSCRGPGSFAVALLDELDRITGRELADEVRLRHLSPEEETP